MRHEDRNGHLPQDVARDTAEQPFSHAAVAVAAHDEEADAAIADFGEQDIADVDARGGARVPGLSPNPVVRQMRADVGAGYMPAVVPVDAEDDHLARLLQER